MNVALTKCVKANSYRHTRHDKTVLSVSRPLRRCELSRPDNRVQRRVCDRWTHSDAERTCWPVGPTQSTPPDTKRTALVVLSCLAGGVNWALYSMLLFISETPTQKAPKFGHFFYSLRLIFHKFFEFCHILSTSYWMKEKNGSIDVQQRHWQRGAKTQPHENSWANSVACIIALVPAVECFSSNFDDVWSK